MGAQAQVLEWMKKDDKGRTGAEISRMMFGAKSKSGKVSGTLTLLAERGCITRERPDGVWINKFAKDLQDGTTPKPHRSTRRSQTSNSETVIVRRKDIKALMDMLLEMYVS